MHHTATNLPGSAYLEASHKPYFLCQAWMGRDPGRLTPRSEKTVQPCILVSGAETSYRVNGQEKPGAHLKIVHYEKRRLLSFSRVRRSIWCS